MSDKAAVFKELANLIRSGQVPQCEMWRWWGNRATSWHNLWDLVLCWLWQACWKVAWLIDVVPCSTDGCHCVAVVWLASVTFKLTTVTSLNLYKVLKTTRGKAHVVNTQTGGWTRVARKRMKAQRMACTAVSLTATTHWHSTHNSTATARR